MKKEFTVKWTMGKKEHSKVYQKLYYAEIFASKLYEQGAKHITIIGDDTCIYYN